MNGGCVESPGKASWVPSMLLVKYPQLTMALRLTKSLTSPNCSLLAETFMLGWQSYVRVKRCVLSGTFSREILANLGTESQQTLDLGGAQPWGCDPQTGMPKTAVRERLLIFCTGALHPQGQSGLISRVQTLLESRCRSYFHRYSSWLEASWPLEGTLSLPLEQMFFREIRTPNHLKHQRNIWNASWHRQTIQWDAISVSDSVPVRNPALYPEEEFWFSHTAQAHDGELAQLTSKRSPSELMKWIDCGSEASCGRSRGGTISWSPCRPFYNLWALGYRQSSPLCRSWEHPFNDRRCGQYSSGANPGLSVVPVVAKVKLTLFADDLRNPQSRTPSLRTQASIEALRKGCFLTYVRLNLFL